jgi:hypothetical protein
MMIVTSWALVDELCCVFKKAVEPSYIRSAISTQLFFQRTPTPPIFALTDKNERFPPIIKGHRLFRRNKEKMQCKKMVKQRREEREYIASHMLATDWINGWSDATNTACRFVDIDLMQMILFIM